MGVLPKHLSRAIFNCYFSRDALVPRHGTSDVREWAVRVRFILEQTMEHLQLIMESGKSPNLKKCPEVPIHAREQ